MLILLIRSHSKICPLPTIANNTNSRYVYCWQWVHFTMGPNEQNRYFAELRQKVSLYIHVVVLLRCLQRLVDTLERFVTRKMEKAVAKLKSIRL